MEAARPIDHRDVVAWIDADPDPDTRAELEALLLAGDADGVRARFGARLRFGTAGLRGEMGAGPNRMNRVNVRLATAALVGHLRDRGVAVPRVAVGFDARHRSDAFAADVAAVVASMGGHALVLRGPCPTPVLAFAVRHLRCDAGVMVTASHNPPADNGYKVYLADGALLVPPHDAAIEAAMWSHALLPRALPAPRDGASITTAVDVVDAYLDAVIGEPAPDALLGALRVVYTPLHGSGGATFAAAVARLDVVLHVPPAQRDPDGAFPTVAYPNPEEPGALDLALALAADLDADVVLAHDPDADRLAVALPSSSGWRVLTGDELGWLLADHLLCTTSGTDRLVATTVVSSSMLADMADAHGVRFAETLTGFKWIVRPGLDDPTARFLFGYEEALGYAVNDVVRDKDGISAAATFLRLMVEWRRRANFGPLDRLEQLAEMYGRHVTGQRSVRFDGIDGDARRAAAMARLRAAPPSSIAGRAVVRVTDFTAPDVSPSTDLLRYALDDGARVMVRPSGTEPKIKVYAEAVAPADAPVPSVTDLLDAVAALLT